MNILCSLCRKKMDKVYRVTLIYRKGLLEGSTARKLYLCSSCLERVRRSYARRVFRIRFRKVGELPKGEEHPLRALYIKVTEELRKVGLELSSIEDFIEGYSEVLEEMRRGLVERYGQGYVTRKCVKNKVGKRYCYAVYRTKDGGEIYLGDLGERIVGVRDRLRALKRVYRELSNKYENLEALARSAKLYAGE